MTNGKTNEKINFSIWWFQAVTSVTNGNKNSRIHVEPASFERQQSLSSPPQTPVAALVSTRKWRKLAALSRTGNAVSMTKMRAGNSMSCLPRNLYQTKSTWYLCLIQKQQRGLLRLQRSWSADLLQILSRNRYRERLHRVLPLPDRCRSTLCR